MNQSTSVLHWQRAADPSTSQSVGRVLPTIVDATPITCRAVSWASVCASKNSRPNRSCLDSSSRCSHLILMREVLELQNVFRPLEWTRFLLFARFHRVNFFCQTGSVDVCARR